MDNSAKILAKGTKSTGITEDLARRLFDNPGMKLMAIVELQPSARHIKKDDKQSVDLEILAIEPVIGNGDTGDQVDEHVRTIQAALYRNRKLAEGDTPLPYDGDGPEPTVRDVLAQGQGLFDDPTDVDDEDQVDEVDGDVQDELDRDNTVFEPHTYIDTAFATCGHQGCGQPAGAPIHQEQNDDVEDGAA